MSENDKDEFRNAIRQIGYFSTNLENPYVGPPQPQKKGKRKPWNPLQVVFTSKKIQKRRLSISRWINGFLPLGINAVRRDVPLIHGPKKVERDAVADWNYRVRVSEWVRKLIAMDDDSNENVKKKNEYMQFLRIHVSQALLLPPFTKPPPDTELPPLPELLGNLICNKVPGLPKPGPIMPSVIHKSPDGRAYISIKHVPGDGVLCYMAVTPDPTELE